MSDVGGVAVVYQYENTPIRDGQIWIKNLKRRIIIEIVNCYPWDGPNVVYTSGIGRDVQVCQLNEFRDWVREAPAAKLIKKKTI